jgi:hypothetical protein
MKRTRMSSHDGPNLRSVRIVSRDDEIDYVGDWRCTSTAVLSSQNGRGPGPETIGARGDLVIVSPSFSALRSEAKLFSPSPVHLLPIDASLDRDGNGSRAIPVL